jgi:hypothetical protein
MFTETLSIKGKLHIALFNEDGGMKEERFLENLVTTAGKTAIASRLDGTTTAVMSHMAVGTGTTAANIADTTLVTEIDRNALDSSTPSTNTEIYVCTWAAGDGTGALTEAGVLNASSSGTLLCRTVFSVINKGASDSLVITWTITIS